MKQLPILVLMSCPCVGASLCSLCESSGFGGTAGFEVSMAWGFSYTQWLYWEWSQGRGLEQELRESWVSPRYDGSLHLGLGHGWGLRASGCTSVLVLLFPQCAPLVRGWVGTMPLIWPHALHSVHRDVHSSGGTLPPDCGQRFVSW